MPVGPVTPRQTRVTEGVAPRTHSRFCAAFRRFACLVKWFCYFGLFLFGTTRFFRGSFVPYGFYSDSLRHAGRMWCYRAISVLHVPPPSTKREAWMRLFSAIVSRLLPLFFFCTVLLFLNWLKAPSQSKNHYEFLISTAYTICGSKITRELKVTCINLTHKRNPPISQPP